MSGQSSRAPRRRTWFGRFTYTADAVLCNLIAIAFSPIVIVLVVHEWWRENRPPEVYDVE